MEKTNLGAQAPIANDVEDEAGELRTLADLEMSVVGGGDGNTGWP